MKPSDRVLLTSLASGVRLRELAAAVREGALVGLGRRDEVWEARRQCAEFDHVMFIEGSREEIPWAEEWFDVIVDGTPEAPTPEMLRVLRREGKVVGIGGVAS